MFELAANSTSRCAIVASFLNNNYVIGLQPGIVSAVRPRTNLEFNDPTLFQISVSVATNRAKVAKELCAVGQSFHKAPPTVPTHDFAAYPLGMIALLYFGHVPLHLLTLYSFIQTMQRLNTTGSRTVVCVVGLFHLVEGSLKLLRRLDGLFGLSLRRANLPLPNHYNHKED